MRWLSLLLDLSLTSAMKHSWTKLPFSVPATQRLGNRYYIDIDRIDNETIFKSVAMYADGGEVLFGEFKENNSCVAFPSHFFTTKKCNHEFYLLHTNYETFERKPLMKAISDKRCKMVGIGSNAIIFVKK
ncbi:unnamed protein product [Cylicocyclus nassatus]|uniref:Uncharacterized protein n=1 Tax=Cylicocyclus nassatus TaxID=53992 RepID=A0AA36M0P8_CYLNA|nr:unnamed protein product [Cylicocyclus nassatus]